MRPFSLVYTLPPEKEVWCAEVNDFTRTLGTLDQMFGSPAARTRHNRYGVYRYPGGEVVLFFARSEERGPQAQPFTYCRITARTPGAMLWLQLNAPEGYEVR